MLNPLSLQIQSIARKRRNWKIHILNLLILREYGGSFKSEKTLQQHIRYQKVFSFITTYLKSFVSLSTLICTKKTCCLFPQTSKSNWNCRCRNIIIQNKKSFALCASTIETSELNNSWLERIFLPKTTTADMTILKCHELNQATENSMSLNPYRQIFWFHFC